MDTLSKFSIPTIGFLITVAFGFWLSRLGKPYNGILFNLHKLIALGLVIITALRVYEALKGAPVQTVVIGLVVMTGLAVVALFVSGAFLSIGNVKYEVVKLIHNVAPVVAVLAMGSVIYLLSGRIP
jgi:hypothetical protein